MTVHLGMRGGGGRKIGRRELGVNRIECKREVERRGSVGEVIKKTKNKTITLTSLRLTHSSHVR